MGIGGVVEYCMVSKGHRSERAVGAGVGVGRWVPASAGRPSTKRAACTSARAARRAAWALRRAP